jgi:hypothetical protein
MSLIDRTDLRGRILQGAGLAGLLAVFPAAGAPDHSLHPVASRIVTVICSGLAGAIAGAVYFLTQSFDEAGRARRWISVIATGVAFSISVLALIAATSWILPYE